MKTNRILASRIAAAALASLSSLPLHARQPLTSAAGIAVTLQTPLVVDGGALNPSSLINQSRIEVRSGSIGAVTNNGLIFGDGTIAGAVTNAMSKQALESETVRSGLKDVLLGPSRLYESLREQPVGDSA